MATIAEMGRDELINALSSLKPVTLTNEYECWPQITTTHPSVSSEAYSYSVRVFTDGTASATEITAASFNASYTNRGNIPGNPWEAVADLILDWRETVNCSTTVVCT